jgi:hypothetical protein
MELGLGQHVQMHKCKVVVQYADLVCRFDCMGQGDTAEQL